MKIAVWHNLPSGGGKRALYYHVKGLLQRGHTVESWCPPSADQTYLPLSELINENIVDLRWKEKSPKNYLSKVYNSCFDLNKKYKAMDNHCRICADQINKGNYDVLFVNSCGFFALSSIARYVTIPKVIYLGEPNRILYEAMPRLPWIPPDLPKDKSWDWKYFESYIKNIAKLRSYRFIAREEFYNAKAFDKILVNSNFSRESVQRVYGLNATVCYLGIDTSLFTNQNKVRENYVVGIGAFVREKNIKFIIESLAKVEGSRPSLVWIGNVANSKYLDELTQMALCCKVDFIPKLRVTNEEVVDLLNRARMMVYAPRLEPFGFAPLEANACGLPVVSVAEGGVKETIIDNINGLLVEYDSDSMARAIEKLMADSKYAAELGCNGQKGVAAKWNYESSIDRIDSILTTTKKQ